MNGHKAQALVRRNSINEQQKHGRFPFATLEYWFIPSTVGVGSWGGKMEVET